MEGLTEQPSESSSESIVDILQCPICYQIPTPPIFGCPNGHIVCSSCRDQIQHCGICRSEKFNVRNVLLEELLKSPILPCAYKEDGCEVDSMTGAEYTEHLKTCSYRPIECYSKVGGMDCSGESYSASDYMDHMIEAHGLSQLGAGQKTLVVQCNMTGPFTPAKFPHAGKDFILMSHRDDTRFWTWIAMPDSENDFYAKITLRYYFGREEKTFSSDIFPPKNARDSPEDVLKSGHCLEFNADSAPPTMPPYVWPNYEDYEEEVPVYNWGYTVEITKPQYGRKSGNKVQTPMTTMERNRELLRLSAGNPAGSINFGVGYPIPVYPPQGQFGNPAGIPIPQPPNMVSRVNPMVTPDPVLPTVMPPLNMNNIDDVLELELQTYFDMSDLDDEDDVEEDRGTVRPAGTDGDDESDDVASGPKRIALDNDAGVSDPQDNNADEEVVDQDADDEEEGDFEPMNVDEGDGAEMN